MATIAAPLRQLDRFSGSASASTGFFKRGTKVLVAMVVKGRGGGLKLEIGTDKIMKMTTSMMLMIATMLMIVSASARAVLLLCPSRSP